MTLVFLPRYPEPRKVPTNPHWCPYTKGSPHEGEAPQSSNSVESRRPSPHANGAPLPAPLGRFPPSPLSSFRLKMPRASFPPVHGGGRDKRGCHSLARLSPHSVQLQQLTQESRGCVVFSKLTQLTRIHLGQVLMRSN
jgi:hypothetical protein